MMGAAVATVLGQIVTAGASIYYLNNFKSVEITKGSFLLDLNVIKKFIPLGVCSFLSQISLVASMAAGCIPIVGYNIGAKRPDRAKQLFTYLLWLEALVGLVAFIVVEIFPGYLITIFGANNESSYYSLFAIKSFRIYLCMIIFACVNKATFIYLQSLQKAVLSTMLSIIREVVFGVGFALLLPLFFKLDGVLYSMPLSDLLTFIISMIAIYSTQKVLNQEMKKNLT